MTLILTINSRESIWLLADRRLSYKNRAPRDDARKVMFLETTDGLAILGYAGLGATALGTEPADWMSAVLRSRNYPLEQSLGILADAMKRQFPRHLIRMPKDTIAAHNVIITSLVNNEARLYTIDLVFKPDRKSYYFRYSRWLTNAWGRFKARTPRLGMGGTGGLFLYRDKGWMRNLLHMIKANDRRQISTDAIADHLAKLNYEVHLGISDKSVGPNCIVAWRHRRDGVHKGGGGHRFYTGTIRDKSTPSLPTIANGIDVEALVNVTASTNIKMWEMEQAGETPSETMYGAEIDDKLAKLPSEPDENLR